MKNQNWILLLLALVCGCFTYTGGNKIDPAKVDLIKRGETTHQQLVQWFGAPMATTQSADGRTVLTFSHYAGSGGAFLVTGGAQTQMQTLSVILTNGIVESITRSSFTNRSTFNTVP